MENLSLRNKTLIILSLVCIVFIGITSTYYYHYINKSFLEIETSEVETNITRINNQIRSNHINIMSKISDWAQWDDTYRFLKDKNNHYRKANLNQNLNYLNLDLMSLWTQDKKLVWGKFLGSTDSTQSSGQLPIPNNDLVTIGKIDLFFKSNLDKENNYKFVQLESGTYLLVALPVVSTDGKSPVRGSMIAGIKLDNSFFSELSSSLQFKIEIMNNVDLKNLKRLNNNLSINFNDPSEIIAYGEVRDSHLKTILVYRATFPRPIYKIALKSIQFYLLSMVFFGIILLFVIYHIIYRLIISKVFKLNLSIQQINKNENLMTYIPNMGNDEIGHIGISINLMLKEIYNLRSASIHNEKMAALGEMAGGIAHEINNPISIIKASAISIKKILERGQANDNEIILKRIECINQTVDRIHSTVTGLKNISRDSTIENFTHTPLLAILNDAISVSAEKLKFAGVRIIFNSEDPIFQTSILGARVQLSQVFLNLIGNAFDAVENSVNPWIEITGYYFEGSLFINVKDSGEGISKELQSKIFQPFFTSKEVGKGTGIGLSISNKIIKHHNGELYIKKDSKNTCFVLKLPVEEYLVTQSVLM